MVQTERGGRRGGPVVSENISTPGVWGGNVHRAPECRPAFIYDVILVRSSYSPKLSYISDGLWRANRMNGYTQMPTPLCRDSHMQIFGLTSWRQHLFYVLLLKKVW